MSRYARPAHELNAVHCAACPDVPGIEEMADGTEVATLSLTCGHFATLRLWGGTGGLDVKVDSIVVYPDRADLPGQRERS